MVESYGMKVANTIMRKLANQTGLVPANELLELVRDEGDNTLQLGDIYSAVAFLRKKGAVKSFSSMGVSRPAFDSVMITMDGHAELFENPDWPQPAHGPIPIYHCVTCDAIINPTDEKCPNGHDLSIVGKTIKLTLTERLTISDSVNLTSKFVINRIEEIVDALELRPEAPENQVLIDEANTLASLASLVKNLDRDMKEEHEKEREAMKQEFEKDREAMKQEFEKDREPVPYSREKGIVIFILGVIGGKIIEWILILITVYAQVIEFG